MFIKGRKGRRQLEGGISWPIPIWLPFLLFLTGCPEPKEDLGKTPKKGTSIQVQSLPGLMGSFFPTGGGKDDLTPPSENQVLFRRIEGALAVPPQPQDFPGLPERQDVFVRWAGSLRAEKAGKYSFVLASTDRARLMVGQKELIRKDRTPSLEGRSAMIELNAGEHPFVMEWIARKGRAQIIAGWEPPGGTREVIPERVLQCRAESSLRPSLPPLLQERNRAWAQTILKSWRFEELRQAVEKDPKLEKAREKIKEAKAKAAQAEKNLTETRHLVQLALPQFRTLQAARDEALRKLQQAQKELDRANQTKSGMAPEWQGEVNRWNQEAETKSKELEGFGATVDNRDSVVRAKNDLAKAIAAAEEAERQQAAVRKELLDHDLFAQRLNREREEAERKIKECETQAAKDRESRQAQIRQQIETARKELQEFEEKTRKDIEARRTTIKDLENKIRREETSTWGAP